MAPYPVFGEGGGSTGEMISTSDDGTLRSFSTGATRDTAEDKLRYEGFLSPVVLKRYAEYMHKHRQQSDGSLRDPDNWQRLFGDDHYNVCIDSGLRHFMDWWLHHRHYDEETTEDLEESICALLFNAQAYLFKLLKDKSKG